MYGSTHSSYEVYCAPMERKKWLSANSINIWLLRSQNIVRSNNDSEINRSHYWRSCIGNRGYRLFNLHWHQTNNGFGAESISNKRALTRNPGNRRRVAGRALQDAM